MGVEADCNAAQRRRIAKENQANCHLFARNSIALLQNMRTVHRMQTRQTDYLNNEKYKTFD